MFKHILVALDGSDCSHKALDIAVTLAKEQARVARSAPWSTSYAPPLDDVC
jgi:nucleotide-binding universal stress UspA family protein